MIISAGTNAANGGIHVSSAVRGDLDAQSVTITFGAVNAAIKGADGASLASTAIEIIMKNNADVSGLSPTANQIFISSNKNNASTDYDSVSDVATVIAAVINGDQNNTTLTVGGARTFDQSVNFGSHAAGLLATPTNGGDPDSVFIATANGVAGGVKLQLRGSQTADSGTNAANFGAYGGVWASTTSNVKLSGNGTIITDASGDQTTVTAGNATGVTTVTLTNAAAAPTTLTANVDFFVDGQDSDGTALDNTLTNLNAQTNAAAGFKSVADTATDTITVTVEPSNAIGESGNACKIGFTNGATGTFTNQGVANDDDQAFTGGDNGTDDFLAAFVKGNDSVPETGGSATVFVDGPASFTASFNFPSIPLRANGTEGGASDPYRAYYGIRPAISTTSTQHDPDYCDYLRRLATGFDSFTPGSDFELSFTFTLDDLVVDTTANTVTYTDASYAAVTSFSALNSFGALLNKNVRQFLMPIHGGFEGWDITEKEPLRDSLIGTTRADATNYLQYTLNKALDSVLDSEVVPANLLVMPGIRKPLITDRIISTAESRKDVLAIIDLENDYTPSAERLAGATDLASLGNVTDAVSSIKTRNLNSSYASAFYPWVQASDNLNNKELVWIPPSVAALGAFGKSQAQSELWFAPAGFNRGGLGSLGGSRGPRVLQARQRLDSKERDSLYEVNINPIATFPAEGVVIFGQKTLQADSSALDRINVRRLVLYLKAEVSDISRKLLFDQNLTTTWNRFKGQVEPIMSSTKARFGLSDYKVVLDETTTTADLVDRNIMYAKIFIKPARAIEYIVVDFVITKTGADFV
jgi:hypothetical protein